MKIYIATDWAGTMVFITKPRWLDNGNGTKEWYGYRCADYERLLPKEFKQKIGDMIEGNIALTLDTTKQSACQETKARKEE